ncbi:hypothetical protein M513_10238 [Trichuris suis]|uniref:Integrase catalytic domain-containing protein n=1 Tax=Trichuris suis TaxID=68888 RepID=A0A085LV79_9BILA|nr:hypothetical protein M513_10238 [Trichuris suis]
MAGRPKSGYPCRDECLCHYACTGTGNTHGFWHRVKRSSTVNRRMELSCLDFDIVHRPGRDNVPPDVFSRAFCGTIQELALFSGRGETMSRCCICAECKPLFYRPDGAAVIKAIQPYERLNLDFKGLLPGEPANRFLLCIVDEYSRFPFAFPCPDTSAASVIRIMNELFALFGVPAYVHTGRGSAFMSRELREFFVGKGISCSRNTRYNPQGNGQAERYVDVIWKTPPIGYWHVVANMTATVWTSSLKKARPPVQKRSPGGRSRTTRGKPAVRSCMLSRRSRNYVSIRHLAPSGNPSAEENEGDVNDGISPPEAHTKMGNEDFALDPDSRPAEDRIIPRRSAITRRPPKRLDL